MSDPQATAQLQVGGAPPGNPVVPASRAKPPVALMAKSIINMVSLYVILAISIVCLCLSVSVNSGRISQMNAAIAGLQELAARSGRSPSSTEAANIETRRVELTADRDSLLGQIGYGRSEDWDAGITDCLGRNVARCFHRNANETNNFYIAAAGGLIGASILWLLAPPAFVNQNGALGRDILLGILLGLLALFVIRGTSGSFLTSMSGLVQIDNPYGLAFICTAVSLAGRRYVETIVLRLIPGQASTDRAIAEQKAPSDGTGARSPIGNRDKPPRPDGT
jgi:hypothetical protein